MTYYDIDLKAGKFVASTSGRDQLITCMSIIGNLIHENSVQHSINCPNDECTNTEALLFHAFEMPKHIFENYFSDLRWSCFKNGISTSMDEMLASLDSQDFIEIYFSEI